MRRPLLSFKCLICVYLCSSVANSSLASDWAHWRGPEQTGVSRETGLPDKFGYDTAAPNSNIVWKQPIGCRSTPMVLDGRVFIITGDGSGIDEGERVVAFDADDGKILWEDKFNVFHSDIVSSRVGWSNPAGDKETGYVYTHGVQGLFTCYDGKTGKIVWRRSLSEEYGRVSGYGGRTTTPIVEGNLVIVGFINNSWGSQSLRGGNRFVAFDKRTGTPVWWSDPADRVKVTYCSCPVVATIGGQRLFITGSADGHLIALQANTGVKVWDYPVGAMALNSSPVVDGSYVYITNDQENAGQADQGRIVCVDGAQVENGHPKLVWEAFGVKAGLSSPMIHDGRLYVADDGATLFCFDAKKGGRYIWKYKYGNQARGAPVWADGKIYITAVNARLGILRDDGKRCRPVYEHRFFSKAGGVLVECNSTPAVSNGRVYFATADDVYCIGKKDVTPTPIRNDASVEAVPPSKEPPAHVQVIPADTVLTPGGKASFKVKLFDAKGHFIKDAPADSWSLAAAPVVPSSTYTPAVLAGAIKDGHLTVSADAGGQQGMVVAKVGNLTGAARVRVVNTLPYKPDFTKMPLGSFPGGWLNAQGKFYVVEKDGKKVLQKGAVIPVPPIARANGYMTFWHEKDYTVQADVMGEKVGDNMPDAGVVNQRYVLQLTGNEQDLRLDSWDAQRRIYKTMDAKFKPNTWYTLKLTTVPKGDKLLVRGKMWPRGQKEPEAWMLEVEDPRPNREGAAGVYGKATGIHDGQPGAPAYFDNVSVTPNK